MHGNYLIELLLGHLAHRRVAGDPGVVDHDVQAAETLDRGLDQGLDIGRLRDIAPDRDRDVVTAQLLGHDLGFLEIDVAEYNSRPLGDKALRDGQTQTLRSTGYYRRLTCQQRHLDHTSFTVIATSWNVR